MKLLILLLLSSPVFGQLKHVYGIERFRLIKDSVTFTGKVTKVVWEPDGDLHFNLKVNDSTTIVCECICQRRSGVPKIKKACIGYYKKFTRPRVGSRYVVIGYHVFDKKHKWYEIHLYIKLEG